jgi:hypothetical protein
MTPNFTLLARFHLDACPLATTDESFEQFVQFLDFVCSGTDIITVHGELVSQGLQVPFRILETISMFIEKTSPNCSILVEINVIVQGFELR